MEKSNRIVVAITGASGAIYGLQALRTLKDQQYEVHLIVSHVGAQVIAEETDTDVNTLMKSVDCAYQPDDLSAPIASGSFHMNGMLIVPCSIKTLSGVANSYAENLVQRAADVCLKEGRPLLLAVRETPLHVGHLRLMSQAAQAGAVIFPLAPSFYTHPETIEDLVKSTVGRMLSRIGIDNELYQPWEKNKNDNAPG